MSRHDCLTLSVWIAVGTYGLGVSAGEAKNDAHDVHGGSKDQYLVLVDPGANNEFLPAAEAIAAIHSGTVRRFDPTNLSETLTALRKTQPRYVVYVLPPEKIDVDLAHALLEMSTQVDDDPFVDFEYGFITGRDGAAALRFAKRIEEAWKRNAGNKVTLFASWEGPIAPPAERMSGLNALGLSGKMRCVLQKEDENSRRESARRALEDCQGHDALVFMSHGYPDRMESCFRTEDLEKWKIDLSPAILFNCACFNGAPGRWYFPKGNVYEDRGVVARENSIALGLLDSGISGYFAGVDMWHGPLNSQVFYHVVDDGMRLGQAAKAMYDRLALEFLPDRIHFETTLKRKRGGDDAWVQNQRNNGAAMILYGDPAFAPFATRAKHLLSTRTETTDTQLLGVKIDLSPLVTDLRGADFHILPVNRLLDYYSLRTDPTKTPPQLELYRVVPLPAGAKSVPALRVASAKNAGWDVPTGAPQLVCEDSADGKLLHVRVPVQIAIDQPLRLLSIASRGLVLELERDSKR